MELFREIVSIATQILFLFNIFFAIFVIFFEKKNPAVTWAWLMVVLFIPYFGFIVYMILGFDGRKHATFAKKARRDEATQEEALFRDIEGLSYRMHKDMGDLRTLVKVPGASTLNDLACLNFKAGGGALTTNNSVTVFHDGASKFEKLFEDIRNAKTFIHVQYYIFRNDELGRSLIALLAARAAEGLEVRLFVDGMGSLNRRGLYKPLLDAGGKLAVFQPPSFIRINYRNHRKIVVIDGETGYIGGLNVGDEYLGKVARYGSWRDTHLRIVGDAVKDMEMRFIMDWNFVSGDSIPLGNRYFPVLERSRSGVAMQIVSSGPDTKWFSVYNGYSKMITEADKSIYIQTPYFAPDDNIFESLKIAALAGIDVRIIIPANPDHPFVYWASLSYLGDLLAAGVKCYEYRKGFIHSKVVIIDGMACSTGTANMDVRSFKLNFEINAFIFNRDVSKELEREFFEDLKECDEITLEKYDKRGYIQKVKEAVSRLLSPLL